MSQVAAPAKVEVVLRAADYLDHRAPALMTQHTKQMLRDGGIPVVVNMSPEFSFDERGRLDVVATAGEMHYTWRAAE